MNEEVQALLAMAEKAGFSHVGPCDPKTLKSLPAVREMCAADKCGFYDKCWTCPPACGTIEDCEARMRQYDLGVLVQTTAEMEDPMDFEAMMDAANDQGEHCRALMEDVRAEYDDALCLFHGACNICSKCAYPDEPCRFPEKAVAAMEGYGLMVSDVCQDNGLAYYYGPNTVTYTGLFLVRARS